MTHTVRKECMKLMSERKHVDSRKDSNEAEYILYIKSTLTGLMIKSLQGC